MFGFCRLFFGLFRSFLFWFKVGFVGLVFGLVVVC